MIHKLLIILLALSAIATQSARADYMLPLANPITLDAPVIDELKLVSVRVFPSAKRIEVVAKAGDETIVTTKSGVEYDAIIAQIDVEAMITAFLPSLSAAAATKLNATAPAISE